MSLDKSKIVPTAFWVGFLALGFVTSAGAPVKHRAEHAARTAKTAIAAEALVAETDKGVRIGARSATQD